MMSQVRDLLVESVDFQGKGYLLVVAINPTKTYNLDNYTLSVDEIEVNKVSPFPDGTHLVHITVYGVISGKEFPPSRCYFTLIYVVGSSMPFREANYGRIFRKNAYDIECFVPCQELVEVINRGIKELNSPLARESFNEVKPILSKEFGLHS